MIVREAGLRPNSVHLPQWQRRSGCGIETFFVGAFGMNALQRQHS